jgi:hypothetical protein
LFNSSTDFSSNNKFFYNTIRVKSYLLSEREGECINAEIVCKIEGKERIYFLGPALGEMELGHLTTFQEISRTPKSRLPSFWKAAGVRSIALPVIQKKS